MQKGEGGKVIMGMIIVEVMEMIEEVIDFLCSLDMMERVVTIERYDKNSLFLFEFHLNWMSTKK